MMSVEANWPQWSTFLVQPTRIKKIVQTIGARNAPEPGFLVLSCVWRKPVV
jgi:hypothetical protein